jgi:hypothetical protein
VLTRFLGIYHILISLVPWINFHYLCLSCSFTWHVMIYLFRSLSHTFISGTLPSAFLTESLQYLFLDNTGLRGTIPETVINLRSLMELYNFW